MPDRSGEASTETCRCLGRFRRAVPWVVVGGLQRSVIHSVVLLYRTAGFGENHYQALLAVGRLRRV